MDEILRKVNELKTLCDRHDVTAIIYVDDDNVGGLAFCGETEALLKGLVVTGEVMKDKVLKISNECQCPSCSAKRAVKNERKGESVTQASINQLMRSLLGGNH